MSASDEPESPKPTSESEPKADTPIAEQSIDLVAFQRFLDARQEKKEQEYAKVATSGDYPALLHEALTLYLDEQQFTTGDFVQWKPMMRNRPFPIESVPAIVVDKIDPPITTSPEGKRLVEPRDLLIGFIGGDRDFVLTQVAARRFTPWKE